MSDAYQVFGFPDCPESAAGDVLTRVEAALRAAEFVTGGHDADAVLGKASSVLRPGPAALTFDGWRPSADLNAMGLNITDLACGACSAQWTPEDDEYGDLLDQIGAALGDFQDAGAGPDVTCPSCGTPHGVNDWCGQLILAHAAVSFWNWAGTHHLRK